MKNRINYVLNKYNKEKIKNIRRAGYELVRKSHKLLDIVNQLIKDIDSVVSDTL